MSLEVQLQNHTQADVIDHLFYSSEKSLARAHLVLGGFGKKDNPEEVVPPQLKMENGVLPLI